VARGSWIVARVSYCVYRMSYIVKRSSNKYEARNPKQIQNLNDQTLKLAKEVAEDTENSSYLTAEKTEKAEYISICVYTYGVHYVLRQTYPPARAQVSRIYQV